MNIIEHRRLHKVALRQFTIEIGTLSTGDDSRALVPARVYIAGHAFELFLGDQRADVGGLVDAGTRLQLVGGICQAVYYLLVDRLVDEEAAARRAYLSLVEEDGIHGTAYGKLHIGIWEDDVR